MIHALSRALRSIPTEVWVCATVAFLNAVCWSIITPPFAVPDEPDHFAYVQQLAQAHHLPNTTAARYSSEEETALDDLHDGGIHHRAGKLATTASAAEAARLQSDLSRSSQDASHGEESAGLAGTEPPLYYALEAIPYELGASANLLDRLELMRLLSALMAGFTAGFVVLFLREALPLTPWAARVGGLGVALFPLLGFMSGAVTPEGMLYAVSAALFYTLARAFRRGLTLASASAIGAVMAVGLLTKLNFVGLLPGAVLGLVLLARRPASRSWRALAAGLLLAGTPVGAYLVINLISGHAGFGLVSRAAGRASQHGSVLGEISYIWQLYLPPLPGMSKDFLGLFMARQVWFEGFVGSYGWLETFFPQWVYDVALVLLCVILGLAGSELIRRRNALAGRLPELLVYGLMAGGLLVMIGAYGYLEFPPEIGNYAEARYLLPLLVVWGGVLALATRAGGRRWAPVIGALIVVLALAHDVFSQLLVISRYYS